MAAQAAPAQVLRTPFDVLIASKFRCPPMPADLIERPRLARLLDQSVRSPVVAVIAPAGFGKTSVLLQFAQRRLGNLAWVSLDESDNDPVLFLSYIISALQRVHRDLGRHAQDELYGRGDSGCGTALNFLINECSFYPEELILVLDDVHHITNPEVLQLLNTFCNHMPENLKLILSSRRDPPISLSRRQLTGTATVITSDALRFTNDESMTFSREQFSPTTLEQQVNEIYIATNGWPAGFKLASLFPGNEQVLAGNVNVVDGPGFMTASLIEDFVRDEVVNQQSPELRRFILVASLFDRFSAAFIQAVSGDTDSRRYLQVIRRQGLFITPLDDAGEWFRFHDLINEIFRRLALEEFEEDVHQQYHAAAATWFLEHKQVAEALINARLASSRDLVRQISRGIFSELGVAPLRLLVDVNEELLGSDPETLLPYGWALVRHGYLHQIDPVLETLVGGFTATDNFIGLASTATLRAAMARMRGDGQAITVAASQARELFERGQLHPPKDVEARAAAEALSDFADAAAEAFRGSGLQFAGNPVQATDVVGRAIDEARRRQLTMLEFEASVGLVGILIDRGLLRDAYALIQEEREQISRTGTRMGYRLLLIYEAALAYEWNDLAASDELLAESLELSQTIGAWSWTPLLHIARARNALALRDVDLASAALDQAYEAANRLESRPYRRLVDAHRAKTALATGDLVSAQTWAHKSRLTADMEVPFSGVFDQLTFARLLIAEEEHEDAIQLLKRIEVSAEQDGRGTNVIEAQVLQALAYQDLLQRDRAIKILESAIARGEPEGFTRVFIDEDAPMTRLLRVALRTSRNTTPVRRLLESAGVEVAENTFRHEHLAEPLSPREVEIIKLIALGLTNREISEDLYISISTVKRHIANIYGKLGCSNRTEAIQRAVDLNLL